MIKRFKLFALFLSLIVFMGCSSSTKEAKPEDNSNNPVDIPREQDYEIPPPAMQPPLDDYIMHNLIDIPVEEFYCYSGRVPANFLELLNSGLILGIPKCPYSSGFYHEVSGATLDDPSGFTYQALSEKSYEYSFVFKNGDNFEILNVVRDENTWSEKLIGGIDEYIDSKIEGLMEFFPSVVHIYYREHGVLPSDIQSMFEDYNLIEKGWGMPNGAYDAYFEFGIDHTHGKIYAKFKYTFGFGRIFWQDINLWSPSMPQMEDSSGYWGTFPFNETPPSDKLVLISWVRLDNLKEVYNELVN